MLHAELLKCEHSVTLGTSALTANTCNMGNENGVCGVQASVR